MQPPQGRIEEKLRNINDYSILTGHPSDKAFKDMSEMLGQESKFILKQKRINEFFPSCISKSTRLYIG